MNTTISRNCILAAFCVAALTAGAANANAYREKGKVTKVADDAIAVTPSRDWNRLDVKPGKNAETWTLDGEQLNEVTFFGAVEPGQPLVKERSKKREPMPRLRATTLLVEVPELLQNTYRAYKKIGDFALTGIQPAGFLGKEGVIFTYDYLDEDDLPRKGEARATLINHKLYMITFDAPRLHYFDRNIGDFRSLAYSAVSIK